jgi:23S rRNA pseudouridine2605 synthase
MPIPTGKSSRITSRRSPAVSPIAAKPTGASMRTTRSRHAPDKGSADGLERLQKVLASAGLGSRRSCEELITTGRVEVDRQIITQLGTRVDPLKQQIRVDGERLPNPQRVVYLLNKPVGVVTTNYDPSGRPRVVDLVPGEQRLFAIGRLDRMSEGLILMTNDGDLANLLAHPRYGVEKKYHVQVAGVPSQEALDKLRRGISLAEGKARAQRVDVRSQHKQSAVLEMVLDEGKNREIRRMLAQLGHKVHQLKRVQVGTLSLGNLLPGQWRQLAWSEIDALRRAAEAVIGKDPVGHQTRLVRDSRSSRPGRLPDKIQPTQSRAMASLPGGRRRRPGKASTWRKPRPN